MRLVLILRVYRRSTLNFSNFFYFVPGFENLGGNYRQYGTRDITCLMNSTFTSYGYLVCSFLLPSNHVPCICWSRVDWRELKLIFVFTFATTFYYYCNYIKTACCIVDGPWSSRMTDWMNIISEYKIFITQRLCNSGRMNLKEKG